MSQADEDDVLPALTPPYWQAQKEPHENRWLELAERLPAYTFEFISKDCGYVKLEQPKVVSRAKPTWDDLRANFIADLERKILDGEFTNSSRVNYLQSLKEFDEFIALKGLKTLDQSPRK